MTNELHFVSPGSKLDALLNAVKEVYNELETNDKNQGAKIGSLEGRYHVSIILQPSFSKCCLPHIYTVMLKHSCSVTRNNHKTGDALSL